MDWKKSPCFYAIFSIVVCSVTAGISRADPYQYTARTLIEVLPYANKDPFVIEPPLIDKDIQYSFCVTMATLLQEQHTLQEMLKRDTVRQTNWFKDFGRDERKAIKELKKNLSVSVQKDIGYMVVSMTCGNPNESALIVNEISEFFVLSQGSRVRSRIAEKLSKLEKRQAQVQVEMDAANRALDDVCKAWGCTDLEEHSYPHPVTVRLIRLEGQRDELALQIAGIKSALVNLEKQGGESEDLKNELSVLQGKYVQLGKMINEAVAKKKNLDLARIQYKKRAVIRDERMKRLEEIRILIEKLKILHDDPDTPKVRLLSHASIPLEPDPPM